MGSYANQGSLAEAWRLFDTPTSQNDILYFVLANDEKQTITVIGMQLEHAQTEPKRRKKAPAHARIMHKNLLLCFLENRVELAMNHVCLPHETVMAKT